MKFRIIALLAALGCCLSCIEANNQLGGSLVPVEQTYSIFVEDSLFIKNINLKMADSLSGYSSTRIAVGAIRDKEYGLTTRTCAMTLIPMFVDSLEIGKNPVFKKFHFAVVKDTLSCDAPSQDRIMQRIKVFELAKAIDPAKQFDCNGKVEHKGVSIVKGTPIYDGGDSLRFNFTEEFGSRFLKMTKEELKDYKKFLEKYPGILIESEEPAAEGGRINVFELQMGYDSSLGYLTGNVATLQYSAEFNGERRDTTMLFYFGATDFYDLDSLANYSSRGYFPQYCLNLTGHETRSKTGPAGEYLPVEGGGGLKPVIPAKELKKIVSDAIIAKGGDPKKAVINKAHLVFPFEFPDDYTEVDRHWPEILSPTCRINMDTLATYANLTDSSSETEDPGNINRSLNLYSPDITFHVQELIKIDETDTKDYKTISLNNGSYDVWLIIMSNIYVTEDSSSSSDMDDYYNYLAYQSYYNSMYGGYGYGGYGGYGYNDSYYNNYYSYMMMAQYAQSSTSTTTASVILDKDLFYRCRLNGPEFRDRAFRPRLEIIFSLPNDAL